MNLPLPLIKPHPNVLAKLKIYFVVYLSTGELLTYTAYILRCWLEGTIWRYSLEEIDTGKRHGFATLDEFISFMLARATGPEEREHACVADLLLEELGESNVEPHPPSQSKT